MVDSNKLAIIVHHNNEVTVMDERGYPALCRNCRFSGWRSQKAYKKHDHPTRCLLHSGGADPVDGDRIMERLGFADSRYDSRAWGANGEIGKIYPKCSEKNPDGKCMDFVKAKPLPWWGNFWKKLLRREWRSRKMRL